LRESEKLKVVTKYELLKQLRRKRLYLVLALAIAVELLVLVLLPALGQSYPNDVMEMAVLLSIGPSFAVIGAIFFAGDAIAGEFEGKTGYTLFPNPVRRTTIVVGKYLACVLAMGLILFITYACVSVSLLAIYHQIPLEVAESLALCLLLASSVLGITFFFSSISKGVMGATVMTLIIFFVVSGVLESVLMLAGQPRWFLLSYAGDVVITVYGGYGAFQGGAGQIPTAALKPPEIGTSIWVMVAYLVVFFSLSIWITKRREMI
jgi:ABC-type transport system involved in multi-copper enzyme maturation permease subunit